MKFAGLGLLSPLMLMKGRASPAVPLSSVVPTTGFEGIACDFVEIERWVQGRKHVGLDRTECVGLVDRYGDEPEVLVHGAEVAAPH